MLPLSFDASFGTKVAARGETLTCRGGLRQVQAVEPLAAAAVSKPAWRLSPCCWDAVKKRQLAGLLNETNCVMGGNLSACRSDSG